jgi:hypothetical protein
MWLTFHCGSSSVPSAWQVPVQHGSDDVGGIESVPGIRTDSADPVQFGRMARRHPRGLLRRLLIFGFGLLVLLLVATVLGGRAYAERL